MTDTTLRRQMFRRVACLFLLMAACATPIVGWGATTYTWSSSVASGGWSVPANWSQDTYPNNSADTAKIASAATVTLSEDISVKDFYVNGSSAKYLDLNDYTLSIMGTAAWSSGFRMNQCGGTPTKRGDFACAKGLFAQNGTFTMAAPVVLPSDAWSQPYVNYSGVAVNGRFDEMWVSTRIILRDGSVWTPGGNQSVGGGYYREDWNSRYSLVCVTGATSRIDSADYNLTLRTYGNGLFVLDGAKAAYKNIEIGCTFRSTNCVVSVDNATLTVGNEIQLGSDETHPGANPGVYKYPNDGSGQWWSDVNLSYGNEIEIKGAAPRVTAETLTVYEGTKTFLTIDVPAAGYAKAPIEVTNLASVARNPLYPDSGAGTLKLTCQQWAKTHPEETMDLIRFETASDAALDEITNTVVWVDYTAQQIAEGKTPILSVSLDGKSLQLTAPELNYKPVFTVSNSKGSAVGVKGIGIHVIDYGANSSSLTSITCEYADNPEYTGSATTNFLSGLSPVTTPVPLDLAYQLIGGFVQHKTYSVRVRATNEGGHYSEQTMTITGDPVVDSFRWVEGLTSGCWQDTSPWTVGGLTPDSCPHAEDTIEYVPNGNNVLMSFTDDAEATQISNTRSQNTSLIFALGGHTLTLNRSNAGDANAIVCDRGISATSDLEIPGPRIVVSNGTLSITQSGICLGYCTSTSSGFLYLEDHATCAAAVKYINNSSRVYVRGGSELKQGGLVRGIEMNNHTANGLYPLLCVTGENSRVTYPQNDITIKGYGAACYVQQGARIDARNFSIGGTNFCWGGAASGIKDAKGYGRISSPDTHVHVENAKLNVGGTLTMGWTGDSVGDTPCNPRLVMGGTGTVVTVGGTLKIYEGMAGAIEYDIPETGFAQDPLTANALVFSPRTLTDFGPTALKLRGLKAWAKANPNAEVNLVKLTEPNAAGLATLKAAATFDWAGVTAANLSVSDDGTTLVLTAPPRQGMMLLVR